MLLLPALVRLSTDVAPALYDNSDAVSIATGYSALKIKIVPIVNLVIIVFRDGTNFHHGPTIEAIFALLRDNPLTLRAGNTGNILAAMRASHLMSPVCL
jgi:hypothetical protein